MKSLPNINIFLVDDHQLVRDGIKARLENSDGIKVIGQAGNGKEAIEMVSANQPDLVLMDISMPIMDGLEATSIFKEKFPDIKILILSMHDEPEYIVKLMQSGASGYILKDVSSHELINTIKSVYHGGTTFCSGTTQRLFNQNDQTSKTSSILSEREVDILKLIANGECNKNIARTLNISVRTVETHRLNIKNKLDLQTTAGLTRYAIEHSFV